MLKETYSWALRRVFRFALRRALGRALKNDLDVNQLDVALGAGTLELRDLVLDCDYLTRQLGHESLRVEEGRVGWVRATIPWNALGTKSCVVEVGDVVLAQVQVHEVWAPREDPQGGDPVDAEREGLEVGHPLHDVDVVERGAPQVDVAHAVQAGAFRLLEHELLGEPHHRAHRAGSTCVSPDVFKLGASFGEAAPVPQSRSTDRIHRRRNRRAEVSSRSF